MGTGELCVNPLAVISDNIITPVEEFDLAPIRTQIPGQTRRAVGLGGGWGGFGGETCLMCLHLQSGFISNHRGEDG